MILYKRSLQERFKMQGRMDKKESALSALFFYFEYYL